MRASLELLNGDRVLHIYSSILGSNGVDTRQLEFKIDTGSIVTIVGINRLIGNNISKDEVKQKGLIKIFSTVSGNDYHAMQFPIKGIKLGKININLPYIFVPVDLLFDKNGKAITYKFVSHEKLLMGTDVLCQLNYEINSDEELFMYEVRKNKASQLDYRLFRTISEIEELELEAENEDETMLQEVKVF